MFKVVVGAVTSRTDHPYVMSLFLLAACFALGGVVMDFVLGHGLIAAFLAIFAGMATLLGVFGYAILYVLKIASMLRNRTMPWNTQGTGN